MYLITCPECDKNTYFMDGPTEYNCYHCEYDLNEMLEKFKESKLMSRN